MDNNMIGKVRHVRSLDLITICTVTFVGGLFGVWGWGIYSNGDALWGGVILGGIGGYGTSIYYLNGIYKLLGDGGKTVGSKWFKGAFKGVVCGFICTMFLHVSAFVITFLLESLDEFVFDTFLFIIVIAGLIGVGVGLVVGAIFTTLYLKVGLGQGQCLEDGSLGEENSDADAVLP